MMFALLFSLALAQEIPVMVIDTGISREVKEIRKYLSDKNDKADLTDDHGHGTHVTGLILYGINLKEPVCNEVKVYSCRGLNPKAKVSPSECFVKAEQVKAKIVNFSGGGVEYLADEAEAIRNLIGKAIVVTAAGNNNDDLRVKKYYPASLRYSNIEIVGNGVSEQLKHPTSNYGLVDMIWRPGYYVKSFSPFVEPGDRVAKYLYMTGTSQSAAIRSHELVMEECKKVKRK